MTPFSPNDHFVGVSVHLYFAGDLWYSNSVKLWHLCQSFTGFFHKSDFAPQKSLLSSIALRWRLTSFCKDIDLHDYRKQFN